MLRAKQLLTPLVAAILASILPAAVGGRALAAQPQGVLPAQRQALIDLYNSTNGAGWTHRENWRNETDTDFNGPGTECSWYGIACDASLNNVLLINLSWNNLTGTLPATLGAFESLLELQLQGNSIAGPIPAQIGLLPLLRTLVLHTNRLTGTIPFELANLGALRCFRLDDNSLTGPIPPGLGGLSNLDSLELDRNHLSGSIPPELGNLPVLTRLELQYNELTGTIPPELGNLEKVSVMWLDHNHLSGSIPPELAGLAAVTDLSLSDNLLSGPIPAELGGLTNLGHLLLSRNQLAGSIPPSIGNLTALNRLDLFENRLRGPIPPELGNLANLGMLYLNGNSLESPIPATLVNLANLGVGYINLDFNSLSTDDPVLGDFIESKAGSDWRDDQTLPPTAVTVSVPTLTGFTVSWTPIGDSFHQGRYRVWVRTGPDRPFLPAGSTASKAASSYVLNGLDPATSYEVAVETITDRFWGNANTVSSGRGAPVSAATAGVVRPSSLEADTHGGAGTISNLNGVFEPGETAALSPSWSNRDTSSHDETGSAEAVTVPSGYTFTVHDSVAAYGSMAPGSTVGCQSASGNCYAIEVSEPETRPALHWDVQWRETLTTGETRTWTLHLGASFLDTTSASWAYPFVESLLHTDVTTGCNPAQRLYCPGGSVTRDQMAAFLARALAGGDANVPSAGTIPGNGSYDCSAGGASRFRDVQPTDWFCRHAHVILSAGVTTGCDPAGPSFCPTPAVTREIMAVFVARAMAGGDAAVPSAYADPSGRSYDCSGGGAGIHFTDVPAERWTCRHVHYIWARGVVAGCDPGSGLYCPEPAVTREEMAKFLVNGFGLRLY